MTSKDIAFNVIAPMTIATTLYFCLTCLAINIHSPELTQMQVIFTFFGIGGY